jgi:hypothetical protein
MDGHPLPTVSNNDCTFPPDRVSKASRRDNQALLQESSLVASLVASRGLVFVRAA